MCALVIVSYHDWGRRTGANNSPFMIDHLKMDIKSNLLAMMPAIASDAHGKGHRPGGEIEFLGTVELE